MGKGGDHLIVALFFTFFVIPGLIRGPSAFFLPRAFPPKQAGSRIKPGMTT
jgi:hypothetical protein